ncbi:hypothetical protein N1F89_20390 [Aquibium sp. A9E412]|uniref:hypothetical protein n=1 Tax=Aquibium sp. A9E412 TaxID=2976767 RepID=UPI0025B0EDDA|nr:hypothetical protein [Aquibium sp. A9E412]MDN2568590.1 hypothetical protein [Aquibium sp. A9E412]
MLGMAAPARRPDRGRRKGGPLTACARLLLLLLVVPFVAGAGPGDDGRWHAGAYAFSDELGGFTIRAVSGTGTRSDPVVIVQELASASPVTLVIRATRVIRPFAMAGDPANGFLYLRLETVNGSGAAWVAFGFELQEVRGEASGYGDGLSFDQRRADSQRVGSDAFALHDSDFEPEDRLVFRGGKTDPGETAVFRFLVTDFTPVAEFYLVQDPRIPYS